MKTLFLTLSAVLTLASVAVTPAFATTGREAVNKCIDTPHCSWVVFDNGSISIVTDQGGVVNCASAEAQCTTGLHRRTGLLLPTTNLGGLPLSGADTGAGGHHDQGAAAPAPARAPLR